MIKEHIAGLGEFEFYDGYFIGRINDGVNAGAEFETALSELIQKHSSGQPIIYISDRVHSYSIDPIATINLISRNNIYRAGIVTYKSLQKAAYQYEESFIKNTVLCHFDSLDAAKNWAEQMLSEQNASATSK